MGPRDIIEKWLKEVHGIYINICNLNNKEYAIININKIGNNYNFPNYNTKTYSSHEEALEKGIQKALTLITKE